MNRLTFSLIPLALLLHSGCEKADSAAPTSTAPPAAVTTKTPVQTGFDDGISVEITGGLQTTDTRILPS